MGTYFPIYMDLKSRRILVFGAGEVALRRIRALLLCEPVIEVIAREISEQVREEFEKLAKHGTFFWQEKCFEPEDIMPGTDMVLAATDDTVCNRAIYERCQTLQIPVNVASDRNLCDFYFPAIVRQEELVIGIAGDGSDHRKVAQTAANIRDLLRNEDGKKDTDWKQREPFGGDTGRDSDGAD